MSTLDKHMKHTGKLFAQRLIDNVSGATQIPEDELANVDDWRRNAESLYEYLELQPAEALREIERLASGQGRALHEIRDIARQALFKMGLLTISQESQSPKKGHK